MGKKIQPNGRDVHELTKKVKELEENWKRALADYHNLEKRVKDERAAFVDLARVTIIDKFLSVLDDLERASLHLNDQGLALVLTRFRQVIESEGAKEMSVEGKEFDPKTMECLEMEEGPKNKVVKVVTKGYIINDHVLRPAKVNVGKGDQAPSN